MRPDSVHYSRSQPVPDRYAPPPRDETAAVKEVLASGTLSGGAEIVADYETALADRFGAAHAIAVNSGTSALHAVLHVLGAGPGTEVMVPATAPLPTAFPVLTTVAAPIIVDVADGALGLDPADVARKLTTGTVASLSLPLWGYPAAVTPAMQVLAEAGVPIIEDAAQAHGTRVGGRYAGTIGLAGCFSTHDRKLLPTGEGGFILTNDEALAEKAQTYTRLGHLTGRQHGVNYKLAAPLAAIGLRRLPDLDTQIAARTANASTILSAIPAGGVLAELTLDVGDTPNYYCLVLQAAPAAAPRVAAALTRCGLCPDTIRWRYRGLHRQPMFSRWASPCPHADALIETTFQIPVHPGLTSATLRYIADAVRHAATEGDDQ
jgi:perosamine synthetase